MEDSNTTDSRGITKPSSAYNYYYKENGALIKDQLAQEGKDTALGAVTAAVSMKWRELGAADREKYEKMAAEDRERYNAECRARDEEALQQQEERRKANAMTETESRMRNSTMQNSDASAIKADAPKRKRELSEEEKERNAERKQAKRAEESAIKSQLDELKRERAQQAEARLKYLLSQSDIFSHFGAVRNEGDSKGGGTSITKGGKTVGVDARGNRRGGSGGNNADEMDDDERAMAMEEEDEEDTNDSESKKKPKKGSILLQQPSCITGGTLRPYQLESLNWMIRLQENGINGILADEMGLGKTLQSISILAYMKEYCNQSGPHLVMVPKSTLSNWCNEFQRFCPSLRILRFHGNKEERQETIDNFLKPAWSQMDREWDVVITTYEIVNLERTALTKLAWNYLIIDEAHRLKNEASQFSQTVRQLSTKYRLLLTGTPLQNNLHELWALLNFLLPDVFASAEQFDDWFNLDVEDQEAKQRMISQLHKLLRPFMLRRLKADVEKSLPPKSETILFTGMSAVQKQLYRQVLLRDIDTINSSSTSNGSRTAVLNIVMQLRKCCNHPYLFPGVEDRTLDPLGDHLYQNCGKMVLLHKLLKKMKERGHRVLIFSQMTRMIDILEDYLYSQGYLYCRIDGNTSYEEREDRIADFNRPDSDKFVFVLSTRAGGLGINLQTADTVILYDSDWNPQADLQAQDRAHRIGQKKPVQVFRLVTDETVEVKVVERAQQKLKLDAMVVQQGRLQDKEKKMTKEDLLDTLRFGADKIFRSKESTITDADIDMILLEGKKRTEEMNSQLIKAEKGDMYDFRLDGGMSSQVFEGKDYSDRSMREAELNALAGIAFIDPGKRERKAVASYAESAFRQANNDDSDKKLKVPRHLRLNKMEDWHFFNKTRLNELHNEELKLFDEMVEKGEVSQANISKLVVLPPELHEEKLRLISEGFGDWTRVHYNNFIRASAKHGRNAFDKIAKDLGRSLEEVQRYAKAFWERGSTDIPSNEWERVVKSIEKGEKRLEEISRLTDATAKLIDMFDDPWEELTFRFVGNQGRIFNAIEDRFLLCLTRLHGYGNWAQIRNSVRRCERFRFDFYLQSCSAEALGKRCELLMRSAERELLEMERKKQVSDNNGNTGAASKAKASTDVVRERMSELTKQIAEDSKRLASTRAQLQKAKSNIPESGSSKKSSNGSISISAMPAGATTSAGIMKAFLGGAGGNVSSGKGPGTGERGIPVPESMYPDLCRILQDAGTDGIGKVVAAFSEKFGHLAKRQIEMKINEIAEKVKKPEDKYIMWHIKPEFEKYLHMPLHEETVASEGYQPTSASKSKKKPGSAVKRKREDEHEESAPASSSKSPATPAASGGPPREPKKYKRAFGFFVREKRAEAQEKLGSDDNAEALRDLLTAMWGEVDDATRRIYEQKESKDKERYERERKEWEKYQKSKRGVGSSSAAESSSKKKSKSS